LIRLGREYRTALSDTVAGSLAVAGAEGSLVGGFFGDVAFKYAQDPDGDRSILLQSLAASLRAPTRAGLYASDLLYKLGMLGTVIGFVVMLGSMEGMQKFDVETLREALQQMTAGMAIALLTTIAGLVCGILLRIQYNIADSLAAEVLRTTVRITEVRLVPGLVAAGKGAAPIAGGSDVRQ